jgi:hypothetical protein
MDRGSFQIRALFRATQELATRGHTMPSQSTKVPNKQTIKAIARAELVAGGPSAVRSLISAWIHDDSRFTFSEKHLRVTEASKLSKSRDTRNSRERPRDSFQEK